MENKLREIYKLYDKKRKKYAVEFSEKEVFDALQQLEIKIKNEKK